MKSIAYFKLLYRIAKEKGVKSAFAFDAEETLIRHPMTAKIIEEIYMLGQKQEVPVSSSDNKEYKSWQIPYIP